MFFLLIAKEACEMIAAGQSSLNFDRELFVWYHILRSVLHFETHLAAYA